MRGIAFSVSLAACLAAFCVSGVRAQEKPRGLPPPPAPEFRSLSADNASGASATYELPARIPANLVYVPQDVAMADLDANGIPDLLTVGAYDDQLAVLLNPGAENVPAAEAAVVRRYSVGLNDGQGNDLPRAIAVADFDGDHRPDVAVVCSGYPVDRPVSPDFKRSSVTVFLGRPGGNLARSQTIETTVYRGAESSSIAAVDYDSDGILDLVVANRGATFISMMRGDGYGRFSRATLVPLPGGVHEPRAIEVIPRPNQPEILVLGKESVARLWQDRYGSYVRWVAEEAARPPLLTCSELTTLTRGDFDGDGAWDLAVGDAAGGVVVYLNWPEANSPGGMPLQTFSRRFYRNDLGEIISLAAGDWLGIGRDFLAAADYEGGRVTILDPLDGTPHGLFPVGACPRRVRLFDWRLRGLPDVVTANEGEAWGFNSPDLGFGLNMLAPPNALQVRGADSLNVFSSSETSTGFFEGLCAGRGQNEIWVAAPDRGALYLLETLPPEQARPRPNVLAQIFAAENGCPYPTDMDYDSSRSEWVVTGSGSSKIWIFNAQLRLRSSVQVQQFDPGPSGFWGVACPPVSSSPGGSTTSPSYYLAAPDARAVVEISRSGTVRRILSTGDFPPMDLAWDSAHEALLATHPGFPGWRSLRLDEPDDNKIREDGIDRDNHKDTAVSDWSAVPIGPSGELRMGGIAVSAANSGDGNPGTPASQNWIHVIANGHIFRVASNNAVTPELWMAEGLRGAAALDRQSKNVVYLSPLPLPALIEFAPEADLGQVWPLPQAALAAATGIPDFAPRSICIDRVSREVLVAARLGRGVARVGWPARVVTGAAMLSQDASIDSNSEFDGQEVVGVWSDRVSNRIVLAYASGMAAFANPPGTAGSQASIKRLSLAHPISTLAEGWMPGTVHLLCAATGMMISYTPAQENPSLTSVLPFIPQGWSPTALLGLEEDQRMVISIEGGGQPLVLILGEATSARPGWRQYQ